MTETQLAAIAADIFAQHGIDFAAARRAGGWTNATWLAGGLALRLATRPGIDSLHREARLAALLPPEVGYPAVIETGITGGHAWNLARALPGQCLGDAWDTLSWDERITALRDLWARAETVHRVSAAEAGELARRRAWFNSCDADEAFASLERLTAQGHFTPQQSAVLRAALERFFAALPAAALVLNHGDMTLDNAMWHAGHTTALLDFEFAVIAPRELDLNHLLKCAFGPEVEPASSPADQTGLARLRATVIDLAVPVIARPGSMARVFGYAILLHLWLFELWLAHPEGEGPLDTWDPYRRLRSLADGQGGYLAPVIARANV